MRLAEERSPGSEVAPLCQLKWRNCLQSDSRTMVPESRSRDGREFEA